MLDIHSTTRYIRMITDMADLSVVYDDDATYPYTSDKRIVLPRPNTHASDEDLLKLSKFALHEALHHIHGPDAFRIMRENGMKSDEPLGTIFNIFEDNRIEREGSAAYPGDAQVISDYDDYIYEKLSKQFKKETPGPVIEGLLASELDARREFSTGATGQFRGFLDTLSPEGRQVYEGLRKAHVVDALKNIRDPQDAFDLSKAVFEMLFDQDPEEYIEQLKEQNCTGEGEEDGDAESQSAADGGEGDEEGEGGAQMVSAEEYDGETQSTEEVQSQFVKVKYRQPSGLDGSPSEEGMHIDYSGYDPWDFSVYRPCGPDEIIEINYQKESGGRSSAHGRRTYGHIEKLSLEASGRAFGNKVRRLIQIESADRYMGGHKSGNIHGKRLYRVGMPQVGSGEYNKKVFRRKEENQTLDTCFTVLCDYSGSMNGGKLLEAVKAALLINDAISQQLNVPLRLSGFSEDDEKCYIGVFKDFDSKASSEKLKENMAGLVDHMGQNGDGDAIEWEYGKLRRRPEKRKVLVVLSDGSPASDRGDAMEHTKRIVKEIQDEGIVEIHGIGIMDRNVKQIYKHNDVIDDASQLQKALLSTLSKTMRRK